MKKCINFLNTDIDNGIKEIIHYFTELKVTIFESDLFYCLTWGYICVLLTLSALRKLFGINTCTGIFDIIT